MNCCSYESTCYPGEGQQGRQRGPEVQQRLIVHVHISHSLRAAGGTGINSFFARNHGWHRTTRVAARCTARRSSEHGRHVWSENPGGLNERKERNRRCRQRRKWQARWFTDGRWLATISGDVSAFSGTTVACAVATHCTFYMPLGYVWFMHLRDVQLLVLGTSLFKLYGGHLKVFL